MSRYNVTWGRMRSGAAGFDAFPEALACYVDHVGDEIEMTGEGYDADHDEDGFHMVTSGLTDDELEAIELANEVAA